MKQIKKEENLISLNNVAKQLKINKSKLNYYAWMGIIVPEQILGKTMIFKKDKIFPEIERIEKLKSQGKKLAEIKKILKG